MVKIRVHLYLIVVTIIYAATFTLAKKIMPTFISPFGFILLRVATAALLLTLTQNWFSKQVIPWRKEWKPLLVCAIFGVAANMLMFFKGLSITHEINAAVMMLFTPIFVFVFSFFLKTERLFWWNLVGVFLSFLRSILGSSGRQRFTRRSMSSAGCCVKGLDFGRRTGVATSTWHFRRR